MQLDTDCQNQMDSSRQMVCVFHMEPIHTELNACISAAKAIETKAQ
jgi:hypothetical protein